jgi:hypothetical protein
MPVKRQAAANGSCQATTKAGHQCAAPAIRGEDYGSLHWDLTRAADSVARAVLAIARCTTSTCVTSLSQNRLRCKADARRNNG